MHSCSREAACCSLWCASWKMCMSHIHIQRVSDVNVETRECMERHICMRKAPSLISINAVVNITRPGHADCDFCYGINGLTYD